MSDTTMDPKAIAQAVAIEVADEDSQVGDFVEAIDLGDNVTDFRFETRVRGYEGWQWSVTLYHDVELDHWTVNESSLVPTDKALRPPEWIPWKDRLEPTDLAVTDSIGTDPDDPRMRRGSVRWNLLSKAKRFLPMRSLSKRRMPAIMPRRTLMGLAVHKTRALQHR